MRYLSLCVVLLWCPSVLADANSGKIAFLSAGAAYWQAWVMNADGTDARQVTHSSYEKARVSWFPDGSALLVNALSDRVYRVDVATGRETELPVAGMGAGDAALSPNGEQLAFSRPVDGVVDSEDIWTVALDGGNLKPIVQMPGLQHEPHWSANGEHIYFLSGSSTDHHDVWRVAANGPNPRPERVTAGALYHFDVAVAPGGQIAFSSNRGGNYDIWRWTPGDGPPEQLTFDPALDGRPVWAPRGESLAFHSNRDGRMNLWRLGLDGGKPTRLTDAPVGARAPAWWSPR